MKTPILKVEDLNISYPNKKRPIVENGFLKSILVKLF